MTYVIALPCVDLVASLPRQLGENPGPGAARARIDGPGR